jgi:hypothetical protein
VARDAGVCLGCVHYHLLHVLAAAGEGATLAGQRGPGR